MLTLCHLEMGVLALTINSKITWHSDDESDEEGPAGMTAPPPMQNRFQRVVVLKGMFDLKDLEKEPELLLDLKEDVREEAESCGQVTSIILYDVRFHHQTVDHR